MWERDAGRCRGALGQRRLDGAAAALLRAALGPVLGLLVDTKPAELGGFCRRPAKLFAATQRPVSDHERAEFGLHSKPAKLR